MPKTQSQRPPALYLYAQRAFLERSLAHGEFCLQPPFKSPAVVNAGYLTLSLSSVWDPGLFDDAATDCCLVINNTEAFGERVHRATARVLPDWAGIDAAISYGTPSPLGNIFTKDREFASQQEWLFAWRPTQPGASVHPVVISIGSIENIAALREIP